MSMNSISHSIFFFFLTWESLTSVSDYWVCWSLSFSTLFLSYAPNATTRVPPGLVTYSNALPSLLDHERLEGRASTLSSCFPHITNPGALTMVGCSIKKRISNYIWLYSVRLVSEKSYWYVAFRFRLFDPRNCNAFINFWLRNRNPSYLNLRKEPVLVVFILVILQGNPYTKQT